MNEHPFFCANPHCQLHIEVAENIGSASTIRKGQPVVIGRKLIEVEDKKKKLTLCEVCATVLTLI